MNLDIDRKSSAPIYIQVKNQIMEEIKNGNLRVGEKMPTERDLAQRLDISRNTISASYNLLENEGVLVSYQGKGTFVAEETNTWKKHSYRDKLLKIVDLGLEEAMEFGISPQEFMDIVGERVKEKEQLMRETSAIFVECNVEQVREFAYELSNITNLNVIPLVLSDLRKRTEKIDQILSESQIIIATFNHVNEVKELTQDIDKEVFGVAINPCLETIVKIARYPSNTRFGLVCISEEFGFKAKNALKSAGLANLLFNITTSKNVDEIVKIIEENDVIIASPGRLEEVRLLSKGKKGVVSFEYNLDQGSVKAVISKFMEIKNKN